MRALRRFRSADRRSGIYRVEAAPEARSPKVWANSPVHSFDHARSPQSYPCMELFQLLVVVGSAHQQMRSTPSLQARRRSAWGVRCGRILACRAQYLSRRVVPPLHVDLRASRILLDLH